MIHKYFLPLTSFRIEPVNRWASARTSVTHNPRHALVHGDRVLKGRATAEVAGLKSEFEGGWEGGHFTQKRHIESPELTLHASSCQRLGSCDFQMLVMTVRSVLPLLAP